MDGLTSAEQHIESLIRAEAEEFKRLYQWWTVSAWRRGGAEIGVKLGPLTIAAWHWPSGERTACICWLTREILEVEF